MAYKFLGNLNHGLVFVISAPAGTGKTTLVDKLVNEFPCVANSISCTTRPPRVGEIPGKDYYFLTESEFEHKIANGDFLEYVQLYGNYYGTTLEGVKTQLKQGKHVILTIDTQGALQLKNRFNAVFIFIQPPSLEELQARLLKRKTETPEVIEKRLDWARKELESSKYYDYNLVNDDLDVAYQVLKCILVAEEHRIVNN